jgi:hypothetical protein
VIAPPKGDLGAMARSAPQVADEYGAVIGTAVEFLSPARAAVASGYLTCSTPACSITRSMIIATPSSSLDAVRAVAAARTAGLALATAYDVPA